MARSQTRSNRRPDTFDARLHPPDRRKPLRRTAYIKVNRAARPAVARAPAASAPGPASVSPGTVLPSSVVTGDRLARAQTLGSTLGPRLRLGDLRQVYVDLLVRDAVEQMPDEIQPGAALVVGRDNVPGRLWRVGGLDHALVGRRVVPPAPHRFGVHRAELPVLDRVVDPGLEPAPLLVLADIEKVLAQDDAVLDDRLPLDRGGQRQEPLVLLVGAEAHHPLDPGPVVPRAVEEDDFARCRELRDVALDVDLGLLAVGGCGQCHVPVDARARAGGDPADHAALARRVAALEDHDDACPLGFDPGLQAGKLDLELRELFLEFLAAHLAGRDRCLGYCLLLPLAFRHLSNAPLAATRNDSLATNPRLRPNEPLMLKTSSQSLISRAYVLMFSAAL